MSPCCAAPFGCMAALVRVLGGAHDDPTRGLAPRHPGLGRHHRPRPRGRPRVLRPAARLEVRGGRPRGRLLHAGVTSTTGASSGSASPWATTPPRRPRGACTSPPTTSRRPSRPSPRPAARRSCRRCRSWTSAAWRSSSTPPVPCSASGSPRSHTGWDVVDEPGSMVWCEVMVHDQPTRRRVLPAGVRVRRRGPQRPRLHLRVAVPGRPARRRASAATAPQAGTDAPAAWTLYFAVTDTDAVGRARHRAGRHGRQPADGQPVRPHGDRVRTRSARCSPSSDRPAGPDRSGGA